ncbi:serine/threonine-protein kinase [Streptomyces turgidiscabies]|uniref:Kinase domain protein n=1 Tax=Streptomyces turgidiscabies (strain Car8) TaxID=698760 RepID=L7FG33_STRT8|nr:MULTISPECIES: serine/threonine-protein kinase [Streptomyces]ELP70026.1 kinase domain protein [Streptomyces turgidiscabies Car8]MDX3492808.1 serine/threonine-protein kinase [Streptomyces turgidiscabies]GAQ75785.1 serine/threonine-protein kinase AfsK [Streptomyces turgidiscabies]
MTPQRNAGSGAEAEYPEYAGQYRLDARLGSGGMGVVHLARSTSGMKLAVKVVHGEFAEDPEFRGRFRQEIAAARRVSGAFTAPVVDADPEAQRPWMATLFIPGPTLADEVKRNGAMNPGQLRRLMAGLAEALRDIHRVGVVHRDLKPSNVLLAEDGPKVIDFGISRPKDSELHTETGKLIGTPPFMAPEQFRRPREVGPAADIFALGSVMVHASTGRGPFDSDSPYVVAYQVVHDEPDLTGVPSNLAPLVLRCLAKEPEDRPTPDELMRELRSVAASYDTQSFVPEQPRTPSPPDEETHVRRGGAGRSTGPSSADSPSSEGRSDRRRLRRRVLLAAGAVVLAAGCVVASLQLVGGDPVARPKGHSSGAGTTAAAAGFRAWTVRPATGGDAGIPQCAYGGEKLFCAQKGLVSAVDPTDGTVLWRHPIDATLIPNRPPVLSGGLVHPALNVGPRLEALDPGTGRPRWQETVSDRVALGYAGGMTLLTGTDGKVTGVDSESGDSKWHRRIAGLDGPRLFSFAGDQLAYATSTAEDGASTRVAALDPGSGNVRWQDKLDGDLQPIGTTDAGASVFFASVDTVYRDTVAVIDYDPATGASHKVEVPLPLQRAHGVVRGNIVYLTGGGGSLIAVDLKAGKQLWRLETSVSLSSAPATDGRYVYFTAADGRLLAVNARTGKLAGQTPPRLGPASDTVAASLPTPVAAGGRVYASAPDGSVFAVDAADPARW